MSIKANVAANYFGQMYTAVMAFAFVPICIRYLGTEAYGLVAIFAILQSSAALLDLGMKPTLAREMARFNSGARSAQSILDLLRTAETLGACVGTVVALSIWAASAWLATRWLNTTHLSHAAVAHALTGMGLICALRFLENIYVGSIIGLQRQVIQCVVSCLVMSARAFGAVAVLALYSPTVDAFFAWQVLISIISIPIYALVVYRSLPHCQRAGSFSWSTVAGIWRFSGGVSANALLALLILQLDKILLSARLPLKAFSYYAVASVLSSALYMLSMPISAAFYPNFTELATRGDTEALRRAYHQAAQLMAVIMGGAAIVLIVFADTALNAWTGDASVTLFAAPLLRVLALGTLLNSYVGIPYQLQLASGWNVPHRQAQCRGGLPAGPGSVPDHSCLRRRRRGVGLGRTESWQPVVLHLLHAQTTATHGQMALVSAGRARAGACRHGNRRGLPDCPARVAVQIRRARRADDSLWAGESCRSTGMWVDPR